MDKDKRDVCQFISITYCKYVVKDGNGEGVGRGKEKPACWIYYAQWDLIPVSVHSTHTEK